MHVSAESTRVSEDGRQNPAQKGKETRAQLEKSCYNCPVYKYKARTDKYLIFRVFLRPEPANAPALPNGMPQKINWKLKGVALLAVKE
jgi:hypothetical protein